MKVDFKQLLAESLPDAKDVKTFVAAKSGIHIDPSKKGTFTKAAKSHGKSVQSFAAQVLSNKGSYSPAMRKKANFAKNAAKWHHGDAGLNFGSGDPLDPNMLNAFKDAQAQEQYGIDENGAPLPPPDTQTQMAKVDAPKIGQSSNGFGGIDYAGMLSLADALIPGEKPKRNYVQPQKVYNQNPYGTGSQAIMEDGGNIEQLFGAIQGYFKPISEAKDKLGQLATMGLMENGGIIPDEMSAFQPMQQGGPVGTKLKKDQEAKYQAWRSQLPKNLQYEGDYDLKGLWLSNPNVQPSSNLHFPDTYKLPNHPTFSNESKYFNPQTRDRAGHWSETDSSFNYIPYNTAVKDTVIEKKMTQGGPVQKGKKSKTREEELAHIYYSYPTANDKNSSLYGTPSAKATSDSAGFVSGYRDPRSTNEMFPLGREIKSPVQAGYMEMLMDKKKPFPEFFPTVPVHEAGGNLSSDKAKEMLRDGTAAGKKLTTKQKKYFGFIAGGGKAADGLTIGGGNEGPTVKRMSQDVDPKLVGYDQFNRSIGSGNIQESLFSNLKNSLGVDDARKLFTAAQIHSKDPGIVGLSPEQRIQRYYDIQSQDSGLQDIKNRIKNYTGTGNAIGLYQTSPDVGIQKQLGDSFARTFKDGGVIYDNGGDIQTHWGGNAEQTSENPYDGGTLKFNGASHDEGGIGMSYNGKGVEVEGGETAVRDADGSLSIMGNMNVPGTKMKFKTLSKKIAKQEQKFQGLKDNGVDLVNNFSPENKFDRLKFNAGNIMMTGGDMAQQQLAEKKAQLSSMQKAMLDTADEFGLDPLHFSQGKMRKARNGMKVKAAAGFSVEDGEPTVADRHNNPGNIKYGKFAKAHGAVKGEPSKDGGYFAKFPDRAAGAQAMKDLLTTGKAYKNSTVSSAIDTWTNHKPYNYNLGDIANKKVSALTPAELDTVFNTMTTGEGTRYGTDSPAQKQYTPPAIPTITPGNYSMGDLKFNTPPQNVASGATPPGLPPINVGEGKTKPTNAESLSPLQILPELYSLGTNREEVVKAQQFNPELFVPYQVSFQDRLDANQSAYSAAQRATAANPAAIGTIAAQMYAANNAVNAEEFRTNQGISNDITNKNIATLNGAQQENLGILDQQYVRQQQAKSKTKEQNQLILNSLSSKYLQNNLENKTLAAYENLYDYRFVDKDNDGVPETAQYFGDDASFSYPTIGGARSGITPNDPTLARRIETDAQGNVKKVVNKYPSDLDIQAKQLDMQKKQQTMPLIRKLRN